MISIITVTFNSAHIIAKFLQNITNDSNDDIEIIIVDNNSMDETATIIKNNFPSVILIENEENQGFGTACNKGAERALGDIIAFLNPDMQCTIAGLQALGKYVDKGDIVAPNIINGAGASQQKVYSHPYQKNLAKDLQETDWLLGACMVMRKEKFKKFDENFFLFFEETDLCKRMGKKIIVKDITLTHHSGTSSGDSHEILYFKNWHYAWSQCFYHQKHHMNFNIKRHIRKQYKYIYFPFLYKAERCVIAKAKMAGFCAYLDGMHSHDYRIPPAFI